MTGDQKARIRPLLIRAYLLADRSEELLVRLLGHAIFGEDMAYQELPQPFDPWNVRKRPKAYRSVPGALPI